MKTRIVFPRLWLDEKFSACSLHAKLLFCYLINNEQLGLSPYLHITDRQIMFDTGLSSNQLVTGKEELTELRWCFFTENWVYHNHKCAYVNYEGRDRVIQSKEKELSFVPGKVVDYFKGLIRGYKEVINLSKTINYKSKTINNNIGVVKGEIEVAKNEVAKEGGKNKYISIADIKENDLLEIAQRYDVPVAFVRSELEDMTIWAESKPNNPKLKGRNWRMTLIGFVKRDSFKLRREVSRYGSKQGIDARAIG